MRFFIYYDFIYHDVLFQKDFSTWKDVGCGCGKSNDHRPAMSALGGPTRSKVLSSPCQFGFLALSPTSGRGSETKPSRFGILILGSVLESITSTSRMMPLR